MISRSVLVGVWLFLGLCSTTAAQSDSLFTFQGSLNDNGQPAKGQFDIDFILWDDISAGQQISAALEFADIEIVNGQFTVELDFGADAWQSARWLEIVVEGTPLSPRQRITSSPSSISTRGIHVDQAKRVGIGTSTPEHHLDVRAPTPILNLEASDPSPTSHATLRFAGADGPSIFQPLGMINYHDHNGNFRASIEAREAGETQARLSFFTSEGSTSRLDIEDSRTVVRDALEISGPQGTLFHFNTQGQHSHMLRDGGRLGIGHDNPSSKLHVVHDVDSWYAFQVENNGRDGYAIKARAGGGDSSSFGTGIVAESIDPAGIGVFATCSGEYGTGVYGGGDKYGLHGGTSGVEGAGVRARSTSTTGVNYGVRSKCDSPAGYDFYAEGAGLNYGSASSRRWKSDIRPLSDPLAMLCSLRGVSYTWDQDHGGYRDIGMIAEEVGKILPEIVQYEPNGVDAVGMDYAMLTPLLVEATKELRAEKDSEIRALEERISRLEMLLEGSTTRDGVTQ